MDRSNVITLLKEEDIQDEYGVYSTVIVRRDVFCNVSSVTASEFFEGGRSGLNPAFRMSLFFGDYENEEMLEYNGQTYGVYRTFIKGTDTVELYVERKGGTNGKSYYSGSATSSS